VRIPLLEVLVSGVKVLMEGVPPQLVVEKGRLISRKITGAVVHNIGLASETSPGIGVSHNAGRIGTSADTTNIGRVGGEQGA